MNPLQTGKPFQMSLRKSLIERFEEKYIPVTESGCWIWLGAKLKSGYGCLEVRGKKYRAHRLFWMLINNKILQSGMVVMHSCDIPLCINPTHLVVGTQKDNLQDMYKKSRNNQPKGEMCKHAKLTAEKVVEIRKKLLKGGTLRKIAFEYGVSHQNILSIKKGETWQSIS